MKFTPYIFITAIIFFFNIIYIWGLDGLLIDDQSYYYILFKRTFSELKFSRNIFHAIFTLGIFKIAGYSSVFFARFLIIILLSIPSAFFIYYFSSHYYQIKQHASIAIAVIPFILPNEVMVPTYLAGSYMLLAILFAMISIFFILRFSNKAKFSITDFVAATLLYYVTTESSELFALMLPVFLFLILFFRKITWNHIALAAIISGIAVRKSFLILKNPHDKVNSVSNELPFSVIKDRIIHFPDYINPLDGIAGSGFLNIIMFAIMLLGAVVVIMNPERIKNILHPAPETSKPKNNYFYFSYFYLFPAMWLIISIIPFIFFSYFFESRYFLVAAVASGFLFVISTAVIIDLLTPRKMIFESVIILIILIAGINRQLEFKKYYQLHNDQYSSLEQTLKSYDLPPEVQIVATAPGYVALKIGNGTINYASGTLQYTLSRRDVKGQIMKEGNFYDPFSIYKQNYKHRNANIDTAKSTCLFRCLNKDPNLNRRLYYALRWVDDSSKSSPWTVFHFNEEGNATHLISGNGYEYYESVVDSLSEFGIRREDIMFGGAPNSKDSLRLGL